MARVDKALDDTDLQEKASRAQRVLYVVMLVLIVVPFVVVWMTGAFRI
jgi:hypothetical protein